jgi:hypothetical protein
MSASKTEPTRAERDLADAHEARAAVRGDEEGSCRCKTCRKVRAADKA